jgi:hypothetical protein
MSPFDQKSPEEKMRAVGGTTETHKAQIKRGTPYGRLLVLGTNDLDTSTDRGYLLKGLISPAEISLWVGPPKCGKSFLLLHVAYMLSLGRSVFGRRVKATQVLYVAAEGEGGIANRIRALRIRYGNSPSFHFIAQPADLLHKAGHLKEMKLAAAGVEAQLIVLDTLSRLMAGGDENAPGDMGMFIANVTELRHDTGAHVTIVHHGTKSSNGSSPRGHGSLTGADDALVEVVKLPDGSRLATVVHAKDDPDGMRWGFDLESVELGRDGDGDKITTLVVQEKSEAGSQPDAAPKLTSNEQIALRCLNEALKASGTMATVDVDFGERKVTSVQNWREWFYRTGKPGESADTQLKAFNRAKDGLIAKGRVAAERDYVFQAEAR